MPNIVIPAGLILGKTAIEEERKIESLDNLSSESLKKDNVREAFKEAIKELIKENPDLLQGLNFNTPK